MSWVAVGMPCVVIGMPWVAVGMPRVAIFLVQLFRVPINNPKGTEITKIHQNR